MSKYKKTSRTLSQRDNINSRDAFKIYKQFREDNKSGLIVPIDHASHRERHCGFCGKEYTLFSKTSYYFDEKFHIECIEKMLNGERN